MTNCIHEVEFKADASAATHRNMTIRVFQALEKEFFRHWCFVFFVGAAPPIFSPRMFKQTRRNACLFCWYCASDFVPKNV